MTADVALFHSGVQHSWQTAQALQELGRLDVYVTSIFYRPDRWPYRLERHLPAPLARRLHHEFGRFSHPKLDPALVETFGLIEWAERLARRLGAKRLTQRLDPWGNRRFARGVTRLVNRRTPAVLWGYNGGALDVFAAPGAEGMCRVLDRTIGDWRAYNSTMAVVRAEWPDFFEAADSAPVPAAHIARDDAEYHSAELILTGSPFAAETVQRANPAVAEKVRVLPYCYDEALFGALPPPRERRDGPVRFLFVGQAGARKGIHLVLEAFARLPTTAATLTILGDLHLPRETFARYADRVTHRATVARADVPAAMLEADALLFPSYFEGSALSLLEGLAAGLALIQSKQAGLGVTPDTGLLLPKLSVAAVHDAMLTVIDDRDRLAAFRAAAQGAAQRYRFARYREGVGQVLNELGT